MRNLQKIFIILFSLLFLLQSCQNYKSKTDSESNWISDKHINIGTFNIAWFGDGIDDNMPRKSEDYELIAEIIRDSGLEVIGLQEIENAATMNLLLEYLPNYSYYISTGGGKQNLAVLYRNHIELEYISDYTPIAVEENRTRPGMFLKGRKGNFDWYLLVVHFKSTSRFDDTPEKRQASIETRAKQSEIVSRFVDSLLTSVTEQDIIIVGDFNDYLERKGGSSLSALASNNNLEFLTAGQISCKNEKWYVIDHIVVNKSARNRFIENSVFIDNFRSRFDKSIADIISDHCPIGVSFEIVSPDND